MKKQPYRQPTFLEKEILNKLLTKAFPGKTEIQEQVNLSQVRKIEEYNDNYGSLELKTRSLKRANVDSRVPVQGLAHDADGVPVEILLHVVDGLINELEIVKADGSPLVQTINPEKIKVIIYSEIKKE